MNILSEEVKIFNIMGAGISAEIIQVKGKAGSYSVSVNDFTSGIYLISIRGQALKFIKQ